MITNERIDELIDARLYAESLVDRANVMVTYMQLLVTSTQNEKNHQTVKHEARQQLQLIKEHIQNLERIIG